MGKLKEDFEELNYAFVVLKSENDELKCQNAEDFEDLKATLTAQKSDLAVLKSENDELKSQNAELVEEISSLRNPPFYHLCVYQDQKSPIPGVIKFNKELYMECLYCDDADFNLSTGVYTNGWPGTYLVSWNSRVNANHGKSETRIVLRKNGQNINEANQESRFGSNNGYMDEQGGRTVLIRMDAGDTLDLFCGKCYDHVYDITFCISLFTFDVV